MKTTFACAVCGKPAAIIETYPRGAARPGSEELLHDDPSVNRLLVFLQGGLPFPGPSHWAAIESDEAFAKIVSAVEQQDFRVIRATNEKWVRFACPECEAAYCEDHYRGGICPQGHVDLEPLDFDL